LEPREQALSQANVEIVRKAFDAYNAGGIAGLLTMCPVDVVWHPLPEWLEDTEYAGHDGVRRLLDWFEGFDDLAAEIADIRDLGGQVVVRADLVGRTTSGVPLRQGWGAVCSDFRDGKIGEWRLFRTWADALAAAGMDE
jgi:ketosteroid isomerase-like protein